MANVNKVILIGRLTRDPEVRVFSNGGKVAKFGFATDNRKKNQTTGEWEKDPMFIDVSVFNRGEYGKLADLAEQSLRKGHQVFLEGHLVLETWDDKKHPGEKRSKHTLVVDNFQFLEPRQSGEGGFQRGAGAPRSSAPTAGPAEYDEPSPQRGTAGAPPEEDIPF